MIKKNRGQHFSSKMGLANREKTHKNSKNRGVVANETCNDFLAGNQNLQPILPHPPPYYTLDVYISGLFLGEGAPPKMGLWTTKTRKWVFGFFNYQTDFERFFRVFAFLLNNFSKNGETIFAAPLVPRKTYFSAPSVPKMGLWPP